MSKMFDISILPFLLEKWGKHNNGKNAAAIDHAAICIYPCRRPGILGPNMLLFVSLFHERKRALLYLGGTQNPNQEFLACLALMSLTLGADIGELHKALLQRFVILKVYEVLANLEDIAFFEPCSRLGTRFLLLDLLLLKKLWRLPYLSSIPTDLIWDDLFEALNCADLWFWPCFWKHHPSLRVSLQVLL